ncbi:MAG: hypothetical protein H6Q20_1242 [Bacteroidetes bacterium]|nr:hypothetical protein [Bacteroidota bacterium]
MQSCVLYHTLSHTTICQIHKKDHTLLKQKNSVLQTGLRSNALYSATNTGDLRTK